MELGVTEVDRKVCDGGPCSVQQVWQPETGLDEVA